MRELAALAETAGARVLDGLLQRRPHPDPSTYLGSGKARGAAPTSCAALGADTVIADTELAPSQRRALEDVVKVKVIDRTAVILDIFSQHAKSREGKAQVELAQLEYLLPRLRGWGESMSRQAGGQVGGAGAGMGSRGPGETKIELDRRRIHTRMAKLRKQIDGLEARPRGEARQPRPLRGAVASRSPATRTPASRACSTASRAPACSSRTRCSRPSTPRCAAARTADGRVYTLADTVGFVRNLPHQLVEAFRSTLEEVGDADVIVHVVDAAHPDPAGADRHRARRHRRGGRPRRARDRGVQQGRPRRPTTAPRAARARARRGVRLRAHRRGHRRAARARSPSCCPTPSVEVDLLVPYDRGDVVSHAARDGSRALDRSTSRTARASARSRRPSRRHSSRSSPRHP